MRSFWFKLFLLAYQAVWLGAVVPGHTRGMVSLAGSPSKSASADAPAAHSCCVQKSSCPTESTSGDSKPGESKPGENKSDPSSHCAVCFYAIRLTLPPVVDLTLPRLNLVATLPVFDAPAPVSIDPLLPYLARGPPMV